MEGAEFDALVADIKANGLNDEIILYEGMILDGRNRYRAWVAGKKKGAIPAIHIDRAVKEGKVKDALAWVISANIHRRHLNAEQKCEVVEKLLKAKPEVSNNAIAKQVKVDDKTVAKVRRGMEARSEIPNVETRTDTRGRKQPAKKAERKRKDLERRVAARAAKRKREAEAFCKQHEIEEAQTKTEAERLAAGLIGAGRGLARALHGFLVQCGADAIDLMDALGHLLGSEGNGADAEASADKRREQFAAIEAPGDPGPIPDILRRRAPEAP